MKLPGLRTVVQLLLLNCANSEQYLSYEERIPQRIRSCLFAVQMWADISFGLYLAENYFRIIYS